MSKCRQCDTPAQENDDTCYAFPYCSDAAYKKEPQEGASPSIDRGLAVVATGGVPSCDSELARIRELLHDCDPIDNADGYTLLRMVDELTADVVYQVRNEDALLKERDDLRAKLDAAWVNVASTNAMHEAEKEELRAKLAEAEVRLDAQKQLDDEHLLAFVEMKKRAEAAEARCRTLEKDVQGWHDLVKEMQDR